MTCALCGYHFCWACGGSASRDDHHFSGNGCGVEMMDSSIKPGDHLTLMRRTGAHKCLRMTGGLLVFCLATVIFIVLFPFVLVFAVPFTVAAAGNEEARRKGYGKLGRSFIAILGFLLGLTLDICFIPLALCGLSCLILGAIVTAIVQTCRWMTGYSSIINRG